MHQIKSLIIILILLMCCNISNCLAATHNWVWVMSDSKYGWFLDTNTIKVEKNSSGKVVSADVWMKIKYSYAGAKDEQEYFNSYNINISDIENGYGMYGIKFKFLSGDFEVHNIVLYDQNAKVLHSEHKTIKGNIRGEGFYMPLYNYLVTYISGCEAMRIYQDKNIHTRYAGMRIFPSLARYESGLILYELWRNNKDSIIYASIDPTKRIHDMYGIAENSDGWQYMSVKDLHSSDRTTFESVILPSSVGESLMKDLRNLFTKYPNFANRFKDGGLTVREGLNL